MGVRTAHVRTCAYQNTLHVHACIVCIIVYAYVSTYVRICTGIIFTCWVWSNMLQVGCGVMYTLHVGCGLMYIRTYVHVACRVWLHVACRVWSIPSLTVSS